LEGLGEVHQEKYYRVKDQRYLGEDEFVEEVEKLSESQGIGYWDISMEDIVKKVGERLGIPWEKMYSLTRERQGAYGRGVVGYLGRKLAGLQVKEIARHFHREPMTVSLGVRKIEDLLRQDPEIAQRMDAIEKELSKERKRKYFITIA
jgi:chromosomal replication initiation ATPase DnaA